MKVARDGKKEEEVGMYVGVKGSPFPHLPSAMHDGNEMPKKNMMRMKKFKERDGRIVSSSLDW